MNRRDKDSNPIFFHKIPWYKHNEREEMHFYPTMLTIGIVVGILFLSNCGNAFCLLRWLSASNSLNIDWTIISWAEPMLGHTWVNIAITAICAIFLGREIVICKGESGRLRFIEKIKWGRKFESAAKHESSMYKEYKKTYNEVARFIQLQSENLEPGAWDKMNRQLMVVYDLLSMEKGERTLPLSAEIASADDEEMFSLLIEQVCGFRKELSELLDIWCSPYGFNAVKVGYASDRDKESLIRVSNALGLDCIIDCYYSGVPLEDLLA